MEKLFAPVLCGKFYELAFNLEENPRRASMLASLLTQLLGKVAEAMLMHAKACNLPV